VTGQVHRDHPPAVRQQRGDMVPPAGMSGAAVDVVFDGSRVERLEATRIETRHTHGTGCVFSAAIAARLAHGAAVPQAIRDAKAGA